MKVYFGFDTSNYTTSFAAVDEAGRVLSNARRKLDVKDGERGLRQSDAVFLHTAAGDFIESAISDLYKEHPDAEVQSVGYSSAPRDSEGSYMPCFLVGKTIARCVSSSMRVKAYPFSHQAGHIAAALLSSGATHLIGKEFAAFHVSGGTTDVLHIKGFERATFSVERIGGTLDLNAGQVIDRAGVMMGLHFPAGVEMEKLASAFDGKKTKYKPSVKELSCNLSGIENRALKLYAQTCDKCMTASFVIDAVGDTLSLMTENLVKMFPGIPIVYAGGVMSCKLLRERLSAFSKYFADPEFSSDNAVGIAYLAMLSSK